jgi:hypothetical protein
VHVRVDEAREKELQGAEGNALGGGEGFVFRYGVDGGGGGLVEKSDATGGVDAEGGVGMDGEFGERFAVDYAAEED